MNRITETKIALTQLGKKRSAEVLNKILVVQLLLTKRVFMSEMYRCLAV